MRETPQEVVIAPAEEAEIRRVLEALDVAWNLHNADAFAGLFSEDADFTNVRGMQASGREAVERFMAPLFATMFAHSEQRILRSETRSSRRAWPLWMCGGRWMGLARSTVILAPHATGCSTS